MVAEKKKKKEKKESVSDRYVQLSVTAGFALVVIGIYTSLVGAK